MNTDGSRVTFDNLQAVDSRIFAAVGAQNVFGVQALGFQFESDIGISKFVVSI